MRKVIAMMIVGPDHAYVAYRLNLFVFHPCLPPDDDAPPRWASGSGRMERRPRQTWKFMAWSQKMAER